MPEGRLLADSASSQFDDALTGSSHLSRIERLPKWLILIPMVAQWIWLGIRYFSFTLPAATNPAITAGGLVGEGKAEYFGVMGAYARSVTADFAVVKNYGKRSESDAERAMREAGLEYPLIAKPDIGWCGFGVRLIRDRAELRAYISDFPFRASG